MKPRAKLRRIVKRVGFWVLASIAALFILSGWFGVRVFGDTFGIGEGAMALQFGDVRKEPVIAFLAQWAPSWSFYVPAMFGDNGRVGIVLPMWCFVVLIGIPTWISWYLEERARRIEAAKTSRIRNCPKCGYDMFGLKGGVKCPECGVE